MPLLHFDQLPDALKQRRFIFLDPAIEQRLIVAKNKSLRFLADICEESEGFVFCHNEALLYSWVEEYEPALFQRIRQLVEVKKWHIMGGWYLQPDCNLPSGRCV